MKISIKNIKDNSLAQASKLHKKWREAKATPPEYYVHDFKRMASGGLRFKARQVKEQTLRFDCVYKAKH